MYILYNTSYVFFKHLSDQGVSHPLCPREEGVPWNFPKKTSFPWNDVMNTTLYIYPLKDNHIQAKQKYHFKMAAK